MKIRIKSPGSSRTATTPAEDGSPASSSNPAKLGAAVIAALLIGVLFTIGFVGAFHAPQAHGVRIAVVAPKATTAAITAGVARAYGSSFEVVPVPSQKEGDRMLRTRDAYGELLVVSPRQWIFKYAGPNGPQLNGVLAATFRPSDPNIKYSTTILFPTASGDVTGLANFFMTFAAVLAGLLIGLVLTIGFAAETLLRRLLALGAASVVVGIADVILVAGAFHSLPGSAMAMLLQALLVFAVGAFTMLCGRLWGLRGLGVAAFLMVVLGMVTSATLYPPPYLTGTLRVFVSLLPPGLSAQAVTGHAYFENDTLGLGLVGLAVWCLGTVGLLYALERRRRSRALAADGAGQDAVPAQVTGDVAVDD